jgi:stalled ribosome alternative rescue factor ArfA
MKTRNPVARDLRTPKYRPQVVKAKKGKGSYNRKKEKAAAKRLFYWSPLVTSWSLHGHLLGLYCLFSVI